ncbi:MAG: branched-chain-amino-acid transaminase, partial [Candidatus Omnitrophica bacterium]|nr:branched-chain-amino-acid transaminase [Candidatus Omnitrophota bacterium]
KLDEHINRLYASAKTIMLDIPLSKKEMQDAVIATLKKNHMDNAYIRLIVTRGPGDLGLDPRKCKRPTVVVITDNIVLYPDKYYKNGLEIITVPTRRNIPEALNPKVKSLNYLNNILAKIEAANAGFEEAIMLNSDGYVLECTGDNIFIVKNGELLTPPTYLGALEGVTRDAVIGIAQAKSMRFSEKVMTRHSLFNAEECFLTGTAAEIIPVIKIDNRVIGSGAPGKVTAKLMDEFRKLTKKDGTKY